MQGGPPELDPATLKQMNCFYPAYIDAALTRPQGRRIPTEAAVARPTIFECVDVFKALGIKHVLEHKFYSRDILRPGRIKYDLSQPDGGKPLAATKRELLKMIAAEIPKLKSRNQT